MKRRNEEKKEREGGGDWARRTKNNLECRGRGSDRQGIEGRKEHRQIRK